MLYPKLTRIGLTGAIGSGKSLVAAVFATVGIPVYNSDSRAKFLMKQNEALRQQIKELFGPQAYDEEGELNTSHLSKLIYNDADNWRKLNGLVHPAVKADIVKWEEKQLGADYVVQEAAILFESGAYKRCNKVVCVLADENIRLKRVVSRDEISPEYFKKINEAQISDSTRLSMSDYLIINDGNQLILPQVLNLHQILINLPKD